MMDLGLLDTASGSEEGRWIEPVNLVGQKIGIKIKVMGPDSKAYARLRDDVQKEAYRQLAAASNGLEPEADKLTEAEREAVFYGKLTLDWDSLDDTPVTFNGKVFPFTEANAITLYNKVPVIREQVKRFCEARRNFIPPVSEDSEKPSEPGSSSTGRAKTGKRSGRTSN
jgi:hypothetical protein